MGYEPEVPAEPTREEELNNLRKLMDNFSAQSDTKLYMNEAIRLNKMDHAERQNRYLNNWRINFLIGRVIFNIIGTGVSFLGLMAFWPRFRRTTSGIPVYNRHKINWKTPYERNPLGHARYEALKWSLPGAMFFGWCYARFYTSQEEIIYENMDFSKVRLPY